MQLDRRRFLKLSGGSAAAVMAAGRITGARNARAAELDPQPFCLGVASGDPAHDSVVLWTRLAPEPLVAGGGMSDELVEVRWEVAADDGFTRGRREGVVVAQPAAAHTLHVEVGDLAPDRWYWYRFTALGEQSRIGRTRTLPAPGAKAGHLRFAVASCQSWAGGPYPAYRDMAEQDLDLVFHLGDYIYETSAGSLEEFRRLHALYKTSPDLRAAHACFPFVVTWDDHEVINNYAAGIGNSPRRPPVPRAPRERLPGLLRAPAAAPFCDARRARHAALPLLRVGPVGGVLDARRPPVPVRPAVRRPVHRARVRRGGRAHAHHARPGPGALAPRRPRGLQGTVERARPADDHGAVRLRRRPGRVPRARRVGRLSGRARADPLPFRGGRHREPCGAGRRLALQLGQRPPITRAGPWRRSSPARPSHRAADGTPPYVSDCPPIRRSASTTEPTAATCSATSHRSDGVPICAS